MINIAVDDRRLIQGKALLRKSKKPNLQKKQNQ
jgi:hypothetical protein